MTSSLTTSMPLPTGAPNHFVQAGHEVVAVEVVEADGHLSEDLCTVDDGGDVVLRDHLAQPFGGEYPTRPMRQVGRLQRACARRHGRGVRLHDGVVVVHEVEVDLDHLDALALLALEPGCRGGGLTAALFRLSSGRCSG
jgi:hypothetical protein